MNDKKINIFPQGDAACLSAYFPKENWDEYFWDFTCFSRQDYARIVSLDGVDEIMLGIQCTKGGCLCELGIRWYMLDSRAVPRLEVFDSAWPLLQTPTFASVLKELTQAQKNAVPTPDEVSALLIAHGLTDQSDRPLG